MQCNSTRFTNGCTLNFLGFIKKITFAACKMFKQSQLGVSLHEALTKKSSVVAVIKIQTTQSTFEEKHI